MLHLIPGQDVKYRVGASMKCFLRLCCHVHVGSLPEFHATVKTFLVKSVGRNLSPDDTRSQPRFPAAQTTEQTASVLILAFPNVSDAPSSEKGSGTPQSISAEIPYCCNERLVFEYTDPLNQRGHSNLFTLRTEIADFMGKRIGSGIEPPSGCSVLSANWIASRTVAQEPCRIL